MNRRSMVLMIASGGVLLCLLVFLYQSTRSQAVAIEPTSGATRSATEATASASGGQTTNAGTSVAQSPAARASKPAIAAPRGTASSSSSSSTGSPAGAAQGEPDPENLHYGGTQLHAQTAAVEPLVRECVARSVAAGMKPSGNAMLTYVVAKRGDKYVVEDTSFDRDETTLQNESLLECLHQTAKQMQFVGLPRHAEAVVVTRSVKLDQGALTEHKHVSFSYLR